MSNVLPRREFLKLGMAASATLAAGALLPNLAQADYPRVTFAECQSMTPVQMAEASGAVSGAWNAMQDMARSIKDPRVRAVVLDLFANPAPSILAGLGDAERKELHQELTAKGYTKLTLEEFLPPAKDATSAPQPFYAAPGSGYGSHHSYPGGLVTHTAVNVMVSLALYDAYRDVYDFLLDRDVLIASQLLHDLHKPWVFQWQEDKSSRTEQSLAGTGEHHSLSVAESVKRGLPAELVVAQACAHNHPRTQEDEAQVVGWLTAGAIIAGKDPVQYGLLGADGATLPLPRRQEGFITHLGDHDWVLTVPAAQWLIPVLQKIAVEQYGLSEADSKGAPFNALRNYVFSQATIMNLYQVLAQRGEVELSRVVVGIVAPA